MDDQALEFHNQVRKAYLAMAAREPKRFRVIDGHPDVPTVARAVWEAVQPALGKAHV
jgi:dTMP kinase